jgi:hypothetical protein
MHVSTEDASVLSFSKVKNKFQDVFSEFVFYFTFLNCRLVMVFGLSFSDSNVVSVQTPFNLHIDMNLHVSSTTSLKFAGLPNHVILINHDCI